MTKCFTPQNFIVLILATILNTQLLYADPASQKAILVTGASSGIGYNITQHLLKAGYYVYAGARKEKDLQRLNEMENVTAVKLDVTKQDQIDAAVAFISAQKRGLYGIINNAGVITVAPMSTFPDDEILWIHDVNVMGPHRINKAFLPLLTESKGRTAIIGSISGFVTGPTSGPYSMSKFAVEAYTESLGMDLKDTGIKVGIIEPGGFKSKIREKLTIEQFTGKYQLQDTQLTEEQQQRLKEVKQRNAELKEPDEVSEAVLSFLSSEKPKTRYMVAPNKEQATIAIETVLRRLVELNNGQPYEYSREELIKMLDEQLVKLEQ